MAISFLNKSHLKKNSTWLFVLQSYYLCLNNHSSMIFWVAEWNLGIKITKCLKRRTKMENDLTMWME